MDRTNVTIEIQGIGPKRANVRSNMQVSSLISTIKDKFNLDGDFEMRLKGQRQPLDPKSELDQAGIAEGGVLVCARLLESTGTLEAIQRGARDRIGKKFRRVYLQEGSHRIEYDIRWQPAIIGRKDNSNPSNNKLLAADLEEAEESPSVSRHHACITEKDGTFFIESVNDRNLTLLNGTKIRPGAKHPLSPGALIQVGNISLTFTVMS
jgi:hypothetical protein